MSRLLFIHQYQQINQSNISSGNLSPPPFKFLAGSTKIRTISKARPRLLISNLLSQDVPSSVHSSIPTDQSIKHLIWQSLPSTIQIFGGINENTDDFKGKTQALDIQSSITRCPVFCSFINTNRSINQTSHLAISPLHHSNFWRDQRKYGRFQR